MKTPENTPRPCRRFDSVLSHSLQINELEKDVPLGVPLADSDGAEHHRKWVARYRWETALFVALALVAIVFAVNLLLDSHPFWALDAALIAAGLLYAAHGSLKESRWHAARRDLHAAAADSEEGA